MLVACNTNFFCREIETMANHASAKKRIRQNKKRRDYNRQRMSRIKTFIKRVETSISKGSLEESQKAFIDAMSELHKGVTKGIISSNTANRKISRLNKSVKSLSAS